MEEQIMSTRAYNNSLFRIAAEDPSAINLRTIVQEWYPVTQAFCLGLIGYNALFAREVAFSEGGRRQALEEAFLVPLSIGAEEFGNGKFGSDGIHYRMFARLGEPLRIDLSELRARPYGSLPETRDLVKGIREAFSDLRKGAACIRVVEGTAYSIVEAMNYLFGSAKQEDGSPLFSRFQMEYITLHLEIEKEHDCIAGEFIGALCDTDEEKERVRTGIQEMCGLFGDFWEALARVAQLESVGHYAGAVYS